MNDFEKREVPGDSKPSDALHPADAALSPHPATGVHLLVDPNGTELAVIDDNVPYPALEIARLLPYLLQEGGNQQEGKRTYPLPESYASLGHILNDALSTWFTGSTRTDVARRSFCKLGESLGEGIRRHGLMPAELSYEQVIFDRETEAPKLLPPVELVSISAGEPPIEALTLNFRQSCEAGAKSEAEKRQLEVVFEGFQNGVGG